MIDGMAAGAMRLQPSIKSTMTDYLPLFFDFSGFRSN